jgi:hypothetical protein
MAGEFLCPVGRSCSHCSILSIPFAVKNGKIDLRALFKDWSILNVNIKEMYFLVALCNDTLIIDPNQGVLQSLLRSYFMDANVDMNFLLLG